MSFVPREARTETALAGPHCINTVKAQEVICQLIAAALSLFSPHRRCLFEGVLHGKQISVGGVKELNPANKDAEASSAPL